MDVSKMNGKASFSHEVGVEIDEKDTLRHLERRRSVDGVVLETKYAGESRKSNGGIDRLM
jgi:hypothetical protein